MVQHTDLETLLATTHEQLFRLALLVTGGADAAVKLLEHAAAAARATAGDPETTLVRNMLPRSTRYGHWKPTQAELQRAQLSPQQAQALLRLFARRDPATRLGLGLHYLRGLAADDIRHVLGEATPANMEAALAEFRADAAVALAHVAAGADHATLVQLDRSLEGTLDEDEAVALRALVFADEETRTLRDGLLSTRTLLPMAITSMFSMPAPADMPQRLVQREEPRQRPRPRYLSHRGAIGALVAGVLALVALIIIVPGLVRRPFGGGTAASAPELIDAAIRRFERPPISAGILHERYRVTLDGTAPQIIERWYDYGTPQRLAAEVRDASSGEARFAIRADGRGSIQYQIPDRSSSQSPNTSRAIDYRVTPEDAQQAIPVLRSALMPTNFFSDRDMQPEISGLYLAQARTAGAALLGRTSANGRDAWLLRYTTEKLPTDRMTERPRQVLLTIDAQLYAVLDITVLAEGAGESIAYRPWQVDQIEVLDSVPEGQFAFASGANTMQVVEPRSVLAPGMPPGMFTTLEEARRRSDEPLLMPTMSTDAMRGLVLSLRGEDSAQYGLLYEGEFQNLLIFSGELYREGSVTWQDEEFTAGEYRYRVATMPAYPNNSILAQVYLPNTSENAISVVLQNAFSTPEELAQRLHDVVASLTPVTDENAASLQRELAPAPSAGAAQ